MGYQIKEEIKMHKKRMTIIINENYEVQTSYKGSTDEMLRCYRSLARHIREQAKITAVLASAASYVEPTPKGA